MAVLRLAPYLSVEEFKDRMAGEKEVRFFKKWQILYAVAAHTGIKANSIAQLLGCSVNIVRRTVQLYNRHGIDFRRLLKWGGRREALCYLSLEREKEVLQNATARALRGEVLVAQHLRPLAEEKTGQAVSVHYLRELLHRHEWKKKAPRPEHPRTDKDRGEEFKKKYSSAVATGKGRSKNETVF